MNEERFKAEHEHIELARLMAPIRDRLKAFLTADFADKAGEIASAKSDDERREIAADMRAARRLQSRLDYIEQRAKEAREKLEKWSNQ